MSKAARKARKTEQRETGTKYQHPTREGVPYGHSKNPNLGAELAAMDNQIGLVRELMVKGFPERGMR